MLTIVARRLMWGIPSVAVITLLLFFSVAGLLGSPAGMMLGRDANPQAIAEMSASVEPHGFAIGDFLATFATITRAFVVAAGMVPAAQAAALPGAPDEATVAVVAARLPEILAAMMSAGLLVP